MSFDVNLNELQQAELIFLGLVLPRQKSSFVGRRASPAEVLSVLKAKLESMLKDIKEPVAFKMSGGADSRILAYLLSELDYSDFEIHMVCHPDLSINTDADVVMANNVCDFLGLKNIRKIQYETPDRYLIPLEPKLIQLTGIFGTEILGGQIFKALPLFGRLDKLGREKFLNVVHQDFREYISVLVDKAVDRRKAEYLFTSLAYSPRTTLYGSTDTGWAYPEKMRTHCLAPLGSDELIGAIGGYTAEEFKNYSFYDQVYRCLPEQYRELPLCSAYYRSLKPDTELPAGLTDAKRLYVKSRLQGETNLLDANIIEKFFSKQVSEDLLEEYFREPLEVLTSDGIISTEEA